MKKAKRIVSLILALAMALMLVACGSQPANSNTDGDGDTQQETKLDWPKKTITIICPYSAGGGSDLMSRAVADELSKRLGVSVVVDDKPGGSGSIGMQLLAASKNDGYTLILTAFLKLGVAMGNPNLGIFIPSALAMPLLALAVADCYKLETELGAADWAKLLTLLFFGFSPFVVGYVGVCIKDVPYMIALLFWLTALIRCCLLHDRFWCSWRQPAQLLLSAVFVVAFRSNGQYVLIPTLLLLLVLELKRRRALSGQRLAGRVACLLLACLLLACLLPSLTVSAVTAVTGSRKPSPREALALPFQQTARLAAEHPEQIRPEEAEIIDRLLDFDSLAEDYNPDTVDPVKLKYNESATGADLAAYLKVWFRQFFRAPSCYVKATLAQNYYLFYPEYSNYYYYYSCVHHDFVGPDSSIHIGSPALVSDVWGYYYQPLFRQAHELPLLYLVNNMTTYIFLFLALLCFTCTKKDWALLPVLLPVFLSLAIIVVAPCIKNHVRYAFPVIYSVPLLFAVYSSRIKTE